MANLFGALRREKSSINIPPVVVVGLGRFGSSLARELMEHGVEVLGIDADEKLVREHTRPTSPKRSAPIPPMRRPCASWASTRWNASSWPSAPT